MAPNTELIKAIKHLMVDKGVGIRHWLKLKDRVSEKLGRSIYRTSFYNALSGYRSGRSEIEILTTLQGILKEMPDI